MGHSRYPRQGHSGNSDIPRAYDDGPMSRDRSLQTDTRCLPYVAS
jgi:hypothetical protein